MIMDAGGGRLTLDSDRFMTSLGDLRICVSVRMTMLLMTMIFLSHLNFALIRGTMAMFMSVMVMTVMIVPFFELNTRIAII